MRAQKYSPAYELIFTVARMAAMVTIGVLELIKKEGAMAGVVGPIVGGWLVDVVGWRFVFIINVPVALAAGLQLLFSGIHSSVAAHSTAARLNASVAGAARP